jgi:3-isopropylmalate/(R)-2-methylmalate dehydratase small subunit
MPFKVEANRRNALLEGLDDIGVTLTFQDRIDSWQAKDHGARPWVWL